MLRLALFLLAALALSAQQPRYRVFVSTDLGVSWTKVHPTGAESAHFTEAAVDGSNLVPFKNKLYLLGAEEDPNDWVYARYWTLSPASGGNAPLYTLNISTSGDGGTTMPPANAYYDESGSYPVEARPVRPHPEDDLRLIVA